MQVIHGLESARPGDRRPVLTIGNFDGVHRAHQAILRTARAIARAAAAQTVVLTFEPHPLAVLAPERAPQRLTPLAEKLRCLELAGVDATMIARTDAALLALEPDAFVHQVLRDRFHPCCVVEGRSFGFGRGRRGDVGFLTRACAQFGCAVEIVEPYRVEVSCSQPELVSSSLIRRTLLEGDVESAAICLGRPYALIGRVVEGDQRGRTLGFPTANLHPDDQMIPADCVYAGWGIVGADRWPAAISIGSAPTFSGSVRRIEAHLLGFSGCLYREVLRLELIQRIRAQQAFSSSAELTAQLHRDVAFVRSSLAKAKARDDPGCPS